MRRALLTLLAAGLALGLGPACGDDDGGDGASGAGDDVPPGAIVVEADEYSFEPETITAPAGEITFALKNAGSLEHDLAIDEADFELRALAGQTEIDTVELEAGTYEIYCSVAGHLAAGMEGTLTVE